MGYRLLEHTADIGLEITADEIDGVFREALRGFTDIVTDVDSIRASIERRLSVTSSAPDTLLVDWLTELVYLFDTEGFLAAEVRLAVTAAEDGWRLDATARGEHFDAGRHEPKVPIKGVTYHGLEVKRIPQGGWRARVVFDI